MASTSPTTINGAIPDQTCRAQPDCCTLFRKGDGLHIDVAYFAHGAPLGDGVALSSGF